MCAKDLNATQKQILQGLRVADIHIYVDFQLQIILRNHESSLLEQLQVLSAAQYLIGDTRMFVAEHNSGRKGKVDGSNVHSSWMVTVRHGHLVSTALQILQAGEAAVPVHHVQPVEWRGEMG